MNSGEILGFLINAPLFQGEQISDWTEWYGRNYHCHAFIMRGAFIKPFHLRPNCNGFGLSIRLSHKSNDERIFLFSDKKGLKLWRVI